MDNKLRNDRAWEIDFLRGIALVLMIIFHVVFDLKDIYNHPVEYSSGIFYYVGKASAILFMIVSGISCSFSRNNVKRGLKILAAAMIITLATYLFMPSLIIKFGILHFFGVSMIIYPLLGRLNKYMLVLLGTLIIVVGNYMSTLTVTSEFLFPIGLTTNNFWSSDYYPIFPWFGVFLYGAAIGKAFYKDKKSIFSFSMADNPMLFIGRHTLLIYLIHQPLTLLILNMIMK